MAGVCKIVSGACKIVVWWEGVRLYVAVRLLGSV